MDPQSFMDQFFQGAIRNGVIPMPMPQIQTPSQLPGLPIGPPVDLSQAPPQQRGAALIPLLLGALGGAAAGQLTTPTERNEGWPGTAEMLGTNSRFGPWVLSATQASSMSINSAPIGGRVSYDRRSAWRCTWAGAGTAPGIVGTLPIRSPLSTQTHPKIPPFPKITQVGGGVAVLPRAFYVADGSGNIIGVSFAIDADPGADTFTDFVLEIGDQGLI